MELSLLFSRIINQYLIINYYIYIYVIYCAI